MNIFQLNVRRFGHLVAGVLLLVFAASHLAGLIVGGLYLGDRSTVFPFATNRMLYVLAAALELAVGFGCLWFRGRDVADAAIVTFVSTLLAYHWGLLWTGARRCGCLGILAKVLHLNSGQERTVTAVTLCLLVLISAPSLCRMLEGAVRRHRKSLLVPMAVLILPQFAYADAMIEIVGEYTGMRFNPETQQSYTGLCAKVEFAVVLLGDTWRICVTNLAERSNWAELLYDGTNTYTICPYTGRFAAKEPASNAIFAAISPGSIYVPAVWDRNLSLFVPWITYGLSPTAAVPQNTGAVTIPLPWFVAHFSPGAYGYRWSFSSTADRRFIESCEVLRDRTLDLPDKKEMLRETFDYPLSIGDWNQMREGLAVRRTITNGWVAARYLCTGWFETNSMTIPIASELEYYLQRYPHPAYRAELKTLGLRELAKTNLLMPLNSFTVVNDYRYKRSNSKRIFRFAAYTLNSGDSWKPDHDPDLLQQAAEFLKHGPRYDAYLYPGRTALLWLLLCASFIFPPVVLVWKVINNKERKSRI